MEEKNNLNNSEEIKNNQNGTEYNENPVKKKEKLNIGKLSIIILILIAVLGTLYAVSCYQINKAKKGDNPSVKTATSVSSTIPSTAEVKRTKYTTATLPRANKQNTSNKKVLKVKTNPMTVRSTYGEDNSNKTNCINNSKSANNSSANRINPITNLNNSNSNSKITISKLSTNKSKKSKKIDYSNKHVNKKEMERLKKSGQTVGYITCKSAKLNRIPIKFGWSQSNTNKYDIVMSDYQQKLFGEGMELYVCGHNNKVLKNLNKAKFGDTILIETTYRTNFLYKITISTKAKIIYKNNDLFQGFKTLNTNKWLSHCYDNGNRINLFTCIGSSNTQRYFVKARRIVGNPIK